VEQVSIRDNPTKLVFEIPADLENDVGGGSISVYFDSEQDVVFDDARINEFRIAFNRDDWARIVRFIEQEQELNS
jgi:hypothetical protein